MAEQLHGESAHHLGHGHGFKVGLLPAASPSAALRMMSSAS